jgi:hypothetical protein
MKTMLGVIGALFLLSTSCTNNVSVDCQGEFYLSNDFTPSRRTGYPLTERGDIRMTIDQYHKVVEAFRDSPGVVGFGRGTDSVRVYYRDDNAKAISVIPDVFQGIRIEKGILGGNPEPFDDDTEKEWV